MSHVCLDAPDAIELVTVLEFYAGWLAADLTYAQERLPLYGAYSVNDIRADTARLIKILKAAQLGP
jgi:hypothetical protein